MIRNLLMIGIMVLSVLPLLVHADYKTMKEDIGNHRFPTFPLKAWTETSVDRTAKHEQLSGSLETVRSLAERWGADDSTDTLFVFSGDSPDMAADMTMISNDSKALEKKLSKRFTLTEIEILGVLRNPGIKAADGKVASSRHMFTQVMDLETTLSRYTALTRGGSNTSAGPLRMGDAIQAIHPFPGAVSLKGRMVDSAVAVETEKREQTVRDVVISLGNTFRELVFIHEAIRINQDMLNALNRLNDVADQLYSSGRTTFSDIIRIRIRSALLNDQRIALDQRRQVVETELLSLLDLPETLSLGMPDAQPLPKSLPDADGVFRIALLHRQELRQMRHTIDRMTYLVEMGESMTTKPYTLNLSLYDNAAGLTKIGSGTMASSFPEKTMAAMKNNRPSGNWFGVNNGWVDQTRDTLESMKKSLADAELKTLSMIRAAWTKADTARREMLLYEKEILPWSQSDLEASTRGYESGNQAFSETIAAYMSLLEARLTLAARKKALGNGIAELMKLSGKRLN